MPLMPYSPDYVTPDTSKNNTTYDTDLTDEQWGIVAPLLPHRRTRPARSSPPTYHYSAGSVVTDREVIGREPHDG
jgi:hypothetical protein